MIVIWLVALPFLRSHHHSWSYNFYCSTISFSFHLLDESNLTKITLIFSKDTFQFVHTFVRTKDRKKLICICFVAPFGSFVQFLVHSFRCFHTADSIHRREVVFCVFANKVLSINCSCCGMRRFEDVNKEIYVCDSIWKLNLWDCKAREKEKRKEWIGEKRERARVRRRGAKFVHECALLSCHTNRIESANACRAFYGRMIANFTIVSCE